ncbi:hypothetical protein D3C78_381660 [compost metagenome]
MAESRASRGLQPDLCHFCCARQTREKPSTGTALGSLMQAHTPPKSLPFPAGRPLSVTLSKTPACTGAGPDYCPRGMGSSQ